MSWVNWIDFPKLGDSRGGLIAIEGNKNVPFDIKRVYYIYATKQGVSRGFHAHKKLRQVAVCVSGYCTILLDNGTDRESVKLDIPNKGILIGDMIWHEMHDFSPDCVLLVLANEHYNEDDYIRNYQEFLEQI